MDGKTLGIGEWKTKAGKRVTVNRTQTGTFIADNGYIYDTDGTIIGIKDHEDTIVGPWEEPQTIIEPDKTTLTSQPDDHPTLRDMFAMAALQGHRASLAPGSPTLQDAEDYARWAYEQADAMLAARKAGGQ